MNKTCVVLSEELATAHLSGVTHVMLLFDPTREIIGIRPVRGKERGYKLCYRSVTVRSLCAHYGITQRGRFPARFENGMILVWLRDEESVSRR